MKKNLLLVVICLFGFTLSVNAAQVIDASKEGDPILESHKEQYIAGPQVFNVPTGKTGTTVTVYGSSNCKTSTGKCEYSYYNRLMSIEDIFKTYVSCAGGETKIAYQNYSGGVTDGYKGSYAGPQDKSYYWSEDYQIVCLKDGENSSLSNSTTLNDNGSSGDNDEYLTDDGTVDGGNTGVVTYYIVLSIIAFGAYILLLLSKKYNLFKKV